MSSLYCSQTAKACNADAASNPKHPGKAEGKGGWNCRTNMLSKRDE